MSKKRYEWIFENGENEIIDNITGQYVTISSPELLNEKDQKIADLEAKLAEKDGQARKKRREFAIITLERVKRFANDVDGMERDVDMVENYIDNQIKQLKEMK